MAQTVGWGDAEEAGVTVMAGLAQNSQVVCGVRSHRLQVINIGQLYNHAGRPMKGEFVWNPSPDHPWDRKCPAPSRLVRL